jgi:hypothetical protein
LYIKVCYCERSNAERGNDKRISHYSLYPLPYGPHSSSKYRTSAWLLS